MPQQDDSNGGMDGVGKTDVTVQAYLNRGRQLWQRAIRETGLNPDEMLPTAYLAWLEKLLPTLKSASRRQYIASSKALLAQMYASEKPSNGEEADLKAAIRRIGGMQSSEYSETVTTRRGRGRTSSQKSKQIIWDDLRTLARESQQMRGRWIRPALLWLATNMLVGLRPSEWRFASLDELEGRVTLVVLNAKNTNGRAHGEKRHLDITGLGFKAVMRIRAQIQSASQHAGDDVAWNAYYTGCRQTIHQLTRKFLPKLRKYPSLYSSRHQFAANAKSAGMSKVELAALMGHAVDDTAGSHYGKKKHGSGACRVKADTNEMDKVRIKTPTEPDDEPGMNF
jgi:hypothetical protein